MSNVKNRPVGNNFNKTMKKEIIIPPIESNEATNRRWACDM